MTGLPTNRKTVDDLIALGGAEPPIMNSPPSKQVVHEIRRLYGETYVPGLSYLFETPWYDLKYEKSTATSQTIQVLLNNQPLMGLFGSFVEHISRPGTDDKYACQVEECIIWGLAKLPLFTNSRGWALPANFSSAKHLPDLDDPHEAQGRLRVLEALLLGPNSTLTENPLCNPMVFGGLKGPRRNELEFWWHLAELAVKGPKSDLQNLRRLLDGQENRDFLYSLVVVREYSHHWNPVNIEQELPLQLSEADPRCRLAVATKFIRHIMESGTTNVIRRFAQLAWRAYILPGANTTHAPWRAIMSK
ncbi:hypothetical protein B0T09DRAFT_128622 [Sordaria sp. MPI-SDFR-AT-0083]|nr:hypothetical protein B0T09DRAFT_128622 [Sordaria sp. MPI-SDFR-AT-0083]